MEVLHRCCAGLDVHQKTVVACLRVQAGAESKREVRTFRATTAGLLELKDWLTAAGCSHAAMESTGVYWKPVWQVLEGDLELVLANAQQVRNLPGRKSDTSDAAWLSDLLAHGLIRGSFVPPTPIQDVRDLTRTRAQLQREIGRHTQRLQKTLEEAGVKLTGTLTDVLGASGRSMIEGLIAGDQAPEALARLRRARVRASEVELVEALSGRVRDHHRFMLRMHLDHVDSLHASVRALEARIGEQLEPFRPEIERLNAMPGIGTATAHVLLAEIGPDMTRFPTAGHLLSWAGLCPEMNESAGKRRTNRLRKGNRWLRAALVQAAWPAARKKDSYYRALYLRLRSRRGAKKAAVAVAASMLTAVYFMLLRGTEYHELGASHFDRQDQRKTAHRLLRRLRQLGLQVEVKPAA